MTISRPLLLLMRHAKSDWANKHLDDFNRPLNQRGSSQAAEIAQDLNKLEIIIDQALISPALRTRQTFDLLIKSLDYKVVTSFDKQLYNADLHVLLEVLQDQANRTQAVIVIAHNPGISNLFNFLSTKTHDFAPADLAVLSPKPKTIMNFYEHSFICEKLVSSHK